VDIKLADSQVGKFLLLFTDIGVCVICLSEICHDLLSFYLITGMVPSSRRAVLFCRSSKGPEDQRDHPTRGNSDVECVECQRSF